MFEWLKNVFGRERPAAHSTAPNEKQMPPEIDRATQIQQAYWEHHPDEQASLVAAGVEQLAWREALRLHHLLCLERLQDSALASKNNGLATSVMRRLLSPESPYRPRPALVWQGESAQPGQQSEPTLQGKLSNASLTHLGCLEFYRLDQANAPSALDFVGFGEITGIVFAPPRLLRAAKLFREDGGDEIIFVPLLYGTTWTIGDEFDREGRMTRFEAHWEGESIEGLGASTGIGVGQQDLFVQTLGDNGQGSLFGLGSVAEISIPLDMRDPHFDRKARARGIDPDQVRREVAE